MTGQRDQRTNGRAEPRKVDVGPGGYLFEEGDNARFAYILEDGEVDIVKHSPDGEIQMATVGKGEIFGEVAVIDGSPRSASARARTDVRVVELDRDFFLQHIAENPQTALKLMARLSAYARKSGQRIAGTLLESGDGAAVRATVDPSTVSGGAVIAEAVEDTDALYRISPKRPLLIAGGALVLLIAVIVGWSALTRVDMTVSASGKFTTRVPNVMVQATDNSVIEELLVERGQVVHTGDLIARLDGTYVDANLTIVEEKIAAVDQRIRRIAREQAVLDGAVTPDTTGLDPINAEILRKRSDEFSSRVNSFDAKIAEFDRELRSHREDLKLVAAQVEIKRQIEEARRSLYKKDVGSLMNLLISQDQRLSAERQRHAIDNLIGTIHTQRQSVLAERRAFISDRSARQAEDLAKNDQEKTQLVEELRKLKRQEKNLFVRSPVDGVVLDLPTVSAGSIVRQGEPMVTLVRSGIPLALEVDIDPKDVSDVRIGAPVSIKLDALPFQQYGDLEGRLVFISDDTFEESLEGEQGAFCRGRVKLVAGQESRLPEHFRLTPGMLATADMKVGQCRLITYFTNPILRTAETAMREPE